MIKMFVENLAWTFNGTRFGKMCWKYYEHLHRKEMRRWDRRNR